ncbi:hypothetical protein E2542_SST20074 [Spatholobus suberectus]|nr:hypothetical protein E2542_SST20074 [Spatholobus suberectus]
MGRHRSLPTLRLSGSGDLMLCSFQQPSRFVFAVPFFRSCVLVLICVCGNKFKWQHDGIVIYMLNNGTRQARAGFASSISNSDLVLDPCPR